MCVCKQSVRITSTRELTVLHAVIRSAHYKQTKKGVHLSLAYIIISSHARLHTQTLSLVLSVSIIFSFWWRPANKGRRIFNMTAELLNTLNRALCPICVFFFYSRKKSIKRKSRETKNIGKIELVMSPWPITWYYFRYKNREKTSGNSVYQSKIIYKVLNEYQ